MDSGSESPASEDELESVTGFSIVCRRRGMSDDANKSRLDAMSVAKCLGSSHVTCIWEPVLPSTSALRDLNL